MLPDKIILEETDSLTRIMHICVDAAKLATCCRSKCGAIIIDENFISRQSNPLPLVLGRGYNSMPNNVVGNCFKDQIPKDFKSDRTCCVHAEQRAIMDALEGLGDGFEGLLRHVPTALYFIRLDENDNPVHAGQPYCTICSKMALDVGISRFVLWHKEGWTSYDTKYYNELSFQYRQ